MTDYCQRCDQYSQLNDDGLCVACEDEEHLNPARWASSDVEVPQ